MNKTTFSIQVSKVHVRIYLLQTFTIPNFLLQKTRRFQHNVKFQAKTPFIIVLIRLLSGTL